MLDLYRDQCSQLDKELLDIDAEFDNILKKSEKSILSISNCLVKLKRNVMKFGFLDNSEEIFFFKTLKPSVFHKLIFFTKVLNIESGLPTGGYRARKKYFLAELKKLEFFYKENREFCQYYRKGLTHLDAKFFLRGNVDVGFLSDTSYYNADHLFTTSHDYLVSCMLAYDKLEDFLQDAILSGDPQQSVPNQNEFSNGPELKWTASKIALVELIYAIQATGCFNNGKADIKELAIYFSRAFNIDLGDFYRNFLEIKNRQNPTKFLELLKENLINKIEQQDS